MSAMLDSRRLSAVILGLGAVALVGFFLRIREQAAIADRLFVRSMIPHHAGVSLRCKKAAILAASRAPEWASAPVPISKGADGEAQKLFCPRAVDERLTNGASAGGARSGAIVLLARRLRDDREQAFGGARRLRHDRGRAIDLEAHAFRRELGRAERHSRDRHVGNHFEPHRGWMRGLRHGDGQPRRGQRDDMADVQHISTLKVEIDSRQLDGIRTMVAHDSAQMGQEERRPERLRRVHASE
jgi:hypothetical protein